MSTGNYFIDPDIRKAKTLPAAFYTSPEIFDRMKAEVFGRAWHWLGVKQAVPKAKYAFPVNLLPGFLDEPLVMLRNEEGGIRCFSNVCTHRGNILVQKAGACDVLRCRYHGRRFGLDGKMEFSPGFEDAEDFPGKSDHLPELPVGILGNFVFTRLQNGPVFAHWMEAVQEKVGQLPVSNYQLDSGRSKRYEVNAHWALYVENYLEGLHIPFVHKSLHATIDFQQYQTELYDWGVVQTAVTEKELPHFQFPEEHPDHGKVIGAYYIWLYPNIMLNFYPWGLSINIVRPKSINSTEVQYLTYVRHPELLDKGPGSGLDRVEHEDEGVVEQVQRGVQSILYDQGRFSPSHETGVHHFQRLLVQELGLAEQ